LYVIFAVLLIIVDAYSRFNPSCRHGDARSAEITGTIYG